MDRCSHQIIHEYHNSCALFSNILHTDSPDHAMTNSGTTEPLKAPSSITTCLDGVFGVTTFAVKWIRRVDFVGFHIRPSLTSDQGSRVSS